MKTAALVLQFQSEIDAVFGFRDRVEESEPAVVLLAGAAADLPVPTLHIIHEAINELQIRGKLRTPNN